MSNPQERQPLEPPPDGASQVRKARMLVSMLGADFAKSSKHPFFKDLAQTAIKPTPDKRLSEPEMSRALEKLMLHLADPKRPAPVRPSVTQDTPKAPDQPATLEDTPTTDFLKQHPALIAKHLLGLPAQERISVLRSLPGRTARLVAAYSAELKKASET